MLPDCSTRSAFDQRGAPFADRARLSRSACVGFLPLALAFAFCFQRINPGEDHLGQHVVEDFKGGLVPRVGAIDAAEDAARMRPAWEEPARLDAVGIRSSGPG